MTEQDAPRITFPCRYPVKIVGRNQVDFVATVTAIAKEHSPGLSADDVSVKLSSGGKFCSVTCTIVATGEPQLRALHEDLRALDAVSLVL